MSRLLPLASLFWIRCFLDQVLSGNDVCRDLSLYQRFYAFFPRFVESNPIDFLKDVDTKRGKADLENRVRFIPKIFWREASKRCAISTKNGFAIFLVCSDKDIEIFCG